MSLKYTAILINLHKLSLINQWNNFGNATLYPFNRIPDLCQYYAPPPLKLQKVHFTKKKEFESLIIYKYYSFKKIAINSQKMAYILENNQPNKKIPLGTAVCPP